MCDPMKPRPPMTRTNVGSEVPEWSPSPSPWLSATFRGGASSRSVVSGVLRGELVRGEPADKGEPAEDTWDDVQLSMFEASRKDT